MFREPREVPERHRAAWRDGDLTAGEGDHALIFKAENVADLSGRHDAEWVIPPAFIDVSAGEGERSRDSGGGGEGLPPGSGAEMIGAFWGGRCFFPFRKAMAASRR